MSTINIWATEKQLIAGYAFDAVLEQAVTFAVDMPSYPIENGVDIADHRIYKPIEYVIRGIVSNTELKASLYDFSGGIVSNLTNNSMVAMISGLSAGYLAGDSETKGASALSLFRDIMLGLQPFDVDTGDMILKNMHIVEIRREIDTENEQGAEIQLKLREMITLDRISSVGQPTTSILKSGTKEQSAISKLIEKGKQKTIDVTDSTKAKVKAFLG